MTRLGFFADLCDKIGIRHTQVPERSMIKVIQWASTLGRRAAIGLGDGGRKAGGLDADTAERREKC